MVVDVVAVATVGAVWYAEDTSSSASSVAAGEGGLHFADGPSNAAVAVDARAVRSEEGIRFCDFNEGAAMAPSFSFPLFPSSPVTQKTTVQCEF